MSGKESLRTNRDLYLFIADLCGRSAESARSLETYLCALWHGSMRHRDRQEISLSCFAALLEEGFREPPPALVAAPPDPRSLEESLYEIEAITWDRFAGFLEAGQWYE